MEEKMRIISMPFGLKGCARMRFMVLFGLPALALCIPAALLCEEPEKVTVCQLKSNPPAYNHKLIEVDAFVSHDFEDFTAFDPACSSWPAVWLEYGGKSKSDTTYCCGPTSGKSRPKELSVESIPISLVEDEQFKQFDKEIQPPFRSGNYGSVTKASIVGRFFAGRKVKYPNGESAWAGYGHMGCCSLLVIQEIKSVSPQDRDDLDYGASYDQLEFDKVGCGPENLVPLDPRAPLNHDQQMADMGERAWAFDDPQRVAADALVSIAKLKVSEPLVLKETRRAPGRIVYEWRKTADSDPMLVVVSRPYVSSFSARDPMRVAWVAVAVYRHWCQSDKPDLNSK